jgi:hypothetical protein
MLTRSRIAFLFVLFAAAALTAACASPTALQQSSSASPVSGTPSEALVQLDSEGKGELSRVDLVPLDAFIAFKPEDRAIRRRWQGVKVGVHDHAHGVRTVLVVPMWFDERTKFVENPWMQSVDTLSEAIKHPDWAWDEAGNTDIKFHLTDEVFYIDEVNMPPNREPDPNR